MRIDNVELKCHKDDEGIYHFSFDVPAELMEYYNGLTITDCTNHLVSLDLRSQEILIQKNIEKEFQPGCIYNVLLNPNDKKRDYKYKYYLINRISAMSVWCIYTDLNCDDEFVIRESMTRLYNYDGAQCSKLEYKYHKYILSAKNKVTKAKFLRDTAGNPEYEKLREIIQNW